MSDAKSGHDWSKDWQALQNQYWTAWGDLTRQSGATPDASTPWHEGLEQWSRMFGSAGKQSEATERLMSSAKSYLSLMQSMLAFAAGKQSGAIDMPWLDAMRGGMGMPGFDASMFGKMPGFDPSAFAKVPGFDPAMFNNMPGFDASLLDNPMAKALREISGQGVKGFQQLAEGAAPMLQQMQQEGLSWLKAPAFGYLREHQEHYQKMALAFVEFQQATKAYNALIMKSSQRSFEILELKLAERSEPGRQIDSVRALYDLWVDSAEEAYAEIALSDEFRKVYGDVVNSQMRVRSQMQQEVERIGVDLGMPTRTELNSVHKRLHDLRRELRASQEGQRDAASDGRDEEIAAMRAEIDDLRRLLENSAVAIPRKQTPVAATPARRAAKANRATAAGRPAPPKSRAAKRAHVAAKSTVPEPAEPEKTLDQPVEEKGRRAHGKKRREARRAPARIRETPTAPKAARAEKDEGRPASFGDAIAAMRRELSGKSRRKKKASASALSMPAKISRRLAKPRRSKP
ncbi:MAG TPA: class III poly(R)-hydroxyalkanoic acid synthase subunit PhaE [Rhodanobacteraceae bacterium]|nr:class III poly(R)-hydroxyalkanoic acid synthase subunit PhaE [Rhodanobacteraceae bacterium]